MLMVKSCSLIFCLYFSNNGVPTILYLLSATTKRIMKHPNFVSNDENQVTEIYCLIGTSGWFAIVNVFDRS